MVVKICINNNIIRIKGLYTQLPQYKIEIKNPTTLLFKSNDRFSYYIYIFDSDGNPVLSETQCDNKANVHCIIILNISYLFILYNT